MQLSTQQLHQVIRSLTKSEKGYFKKYVMGFNDAGASNYILLFDQLDTAEMPGDETLEKYFEKKKKKINLRALRQYLYQQIMRALRAYNEDKSVRFEIRNRLQDLEILLGKGLNRHALALIDETLELCEKHFQEEYAIILLQYKHFLAGYYDWENQDKKQTALGEKMIEMVHHIEHKIALKDVSFILTFLRNKYFPVTNAGVLNTFEEAMKHPLLQNEDEVKGIAAKLTYYHIYKTYYRVKRDYRQALNYQLKSDVLFENNPGYLLTSQATYIQGLYEETGLWLNVNEPARAIETLNKLKSYPLEKRSDIEWQKKFYYQGLVKVLKLYYAQFPELSNEFKAAEDFIRQSNFVYEAEKLITYFDVAVIYFGQGKYSEALDWLNPILNLNPGGNVPYQIHTRLLNLIIHYEMKNTRLVPSLLKNTYRLIMKREMKFAFETEIINLLRRVLTKINDDELKREFNKTYQRLRALRDNPFEGSSFEIFDYAGWLETKNPARLLATGPT